MPSERGQRQINRLLDEAEEALGANHWAAVHARCEAILRLDPKSADAKSNFEAATEQPVPANQPAVEAARGDSVDAYIGYELAATKQSPERSRADSASLNRPRRTPR